MIQKIGIILGWIILVIVVVSIWLAVWYGLNVEIGTPDDKFYFKYTSYPLKRFF